MFAIGVQNNWLRIYLKSAHLSLVLKNVSHIFFSYQKAEQFSLQKHIFATTYVSQQLRTRFPILMDVNMPVMNGLDSSKEIRNIGLNTPIIALTAVNAINPEKDFGSYGIDDAIVKPYKTEQLIELLLKYIN